MYKEDEVEYMLSMIKDQQGDFLKADMITPIYKKSLYTVKQLLGQMLINNNTPMLKQSASVEATI